ncbi:hypothetical protein [Streptomyces sp. NBC_00829]|uniref:hypothetical protein n=1 Tax=Streptomyces sp. NBC_00829 TaxID=2903679 RepID=UPI00386EBAD0|nr:hypothetical protein OG293_33070 [Streptomyces sp. NBC_00829]
MDAVAAHVDALRRPHPERTAALGDGRVARAFGHPPADPLPAAALMALTVAILDDPSGHHTLARRLSALSPTSTAHIRLRQHAPYCSPTMTAVIGRSIRSPQTAAGPLARFPQPATHRGRLDPRTIPVVWAENWAAPLDELDAPRRQLLRDAPIRLVQMATGYSRRSAARYLGFPLGSLHPAADPLRAWHMQPRQRRGAYQSALHRVAEIAIAEAQGDRGGVPKP